MEEKENEYLRIALKKYRLGTATAEEISFLEKYYDLFEEKESFFDTHGLEIEDEIKYQLKRSIDQQIEQQELQSPPSPKNRWIKYFAAASVLIMVSIGTYLAINQKPYQQVTQSNDFVPGSNKAILKLGDGRQILLDNAANGTIAQLDGITITKNAAGEIEYKIHDSSSANNVIFNSITTPNGGKYHVVLPDGTKIWLNAASTLTYPTVFKGRERHVEMTGEGYFEVAKNTQMPFTVGARGQKIEVLGTHFNINAYEDEDGIKTTLLEGAVKVSTAKSSTIIAPGEQTYFNPADLSIQKRTVDVEQETAWKNSLFSFKGDDLKTIMRQIARWYDVEVKYEGKITDEKFYGQISRTSKLSEVFAILELNHVHFKSLGRQIVVSAQE